MNDSILDSLSTGKSEVVNGMERLAVALSEMGYTDAADEASAMLGKIAWLFETAQAVARKRLESGT